MSLVSSINIAQQGLSVSQAAITVVSNNISNVDTEGYSKQRVNQSAVINYTPSEGNAISVAESASGVTIDSISRYSDTYLQNYYWQENSSHSYYNQASTIASNVENLTNELKNTGIGQSLTNFYSAVTALNNAPSDSTARENYVGAAQNVCSSFNSISSDLSDLKESLVGDPSTGTISSSSISDQVDQVNSLLDEISSVNFDIIKTNSGNTPSSTLLDKRDSLITQLTGLIPVSTSENSNGTMNISLGDNKLVTGTKVNSYLKVSSGTTTNPAIVSLVDADDKTTSVNDNINSTITGGSIGAILDLCGSDSTKFTISGVMKNLDKLATNFASIMNTIQTGDPNGDGTTALCIDSTTKKLVAASDNIFVINPTDTTATSITASNISVNSAIVSDSNKIAAARLDLSKYPLSKYADSTGNNSNSTLMTASESNKYAALGNTTIEGYLSNTVSTVGTGASNINTKLTDQTAVLKQIKTNLSSATGVNLDEELVDLIKYQRAYQASARVFSTCNDLLDTLVNLGK